MAHTAYAETLASDVTFDDVIYVDGGSHLVLDVRVIHATHTMVFTTVNLLTDRTNTLQVRMSKRVGRREG